MSVEAQAICYLVAFICFVLAALEATVPRVSLVGAGLAAWVLVSLVIALRAI